MKSDYSTGPSSRRGVAPLALSGIPAWSGSGCVDNIKPNTKLTIATWNCGGLSFTQRELCKDLCDILVLTETHDRD